MSANIQVLGNLGSEPETHLSENGTLVASFSIASNSVQRTPQGTEKKTDWFRVTAVGIQAETLAQHARRGSRLLVEGKLTFNGWKDRAGQARVSADLFLQNFQFVGGKATNENQIERVGKAEYSVETTISSPVQEIGDNGYAH